MRMSSIRLGEIFRRSGFTAAKGHFIMDEREARIRLQGLLVEHSDLDAAIQALADSAAPDQLQIARLKRKKLHMKDEIERLRDIINPDLIA